MKKILFFAALLLIGSTSCKQMSYNYESRLAGVRRICPTCTFVRSEGSDFAQDTSKNPNVIYKVYFCSGFGFNNASTVDHLVRIN